MFCPNCGKDCGNENFCSNCGTKVQQKAESKPQQTAWSAGQPCPHCGSTKLNGNTCAFCGAQLVEDISKGDLYQEDSYEIPYKNFYVPAAATDMHIAKNFLTISKKALFSKNVTQIPYKQLKEVIFFRDELLCGYIIFRWQGNDISNSDALKEYTIYVGRNEQCAYYFHVFYLFKLLAPHAELKTNFADADKECLQRYAHISDLDGYFSRFNPNREQAIVAINREYAIPECEARALIDALFNQKQKEQYDADPSLAARDYNRVQRERRRRCEEEIRKIDERRQHWRR